MSETLHHLTTETVEGVLIMRIREQRIDDWELAESFRKELVDAYSAAASSYAAVDMSNVEYMSSVGYGAFIALKKRVTETEGRLVLFGLSEFITQLFEKTHLLMNPKAKTSSFVAVDTQMQAIARLNES